MKSESDAAAKELIARRYDAISARARQLYEQRGSVAGHELEDWLQAESEIDTQIAEGKPLQPAFVAVKIDGVTYTGEYDRTFAGDYHAGEWNQGDPVSVRLEGDKMILRRKNGRELETRIVKKAS